LKLFVKLTVVVVVLAVATPFFLKGPDGQPLANKEEMLSSDTGFAQGLMFAVDYAKGIASRILSFTGSSIGSGSGSKDSHVTEVQKWQDDAGVWHFSNRPSAPKNSQTVQVRSDRNIIKTDYVEQLAALEEKQNPTAVKKQKTEAEPSRLNTLSQGLDALQKAGDVQSLLDQRAEQQEKLLERYK